VLRKTLKPEVAENISVVRQSETCGGRSRISEEREQKGGETPEESGARIDMSRPSQRDRCRQIMYSRDKSLRDDRSVKTQGFPKARVSKSSQPSVGRDAWHKIWHFGGSHSGRKGGVLDKKFQRLKSQSSSKSSNS
jgi:hypothetical protein